MVIESGANREQGAASTEADLAERRDDFGRPSRKTRIAPVAQPELDQIVTTLRSVSRDVGGRLIFTTADNARWAQTDEWPIAGEIKPGMKVTLRRAALGSFFARFGELASFRVKRLR